MNEKYVTGEKSGSLESLRHLRLMALLRELIRDEGRMEAAEMLGVNYKTLAKTVDTGILSRRMSHALERLLLSGRLCCGQATGAYPGAGGSVRCAGEGGAERPRRWRG